jgi:ribose transport system substrate-binding protein
MHRIIRSSAVVTAVVLVSLGLTACNSATSTTSEENPGVSEQADAALAALEGQVLSRGPHGEEASPVSSAELTDEQVAQVREMGATAAIVLHYGGNDWANAQVDGLRTRFEELGIDVVAVTDADFNPDTQVSDIETVMSLNPDVMISIPTNPVATASAYQRVADAGVELVFMDNAPQGLVAGEDYASVVSADNYGNGVVSAHLLARALGGEGEIGLIYHEADFFVTAQRYEAFKTTIEEDYPDITIVEETGIAGPDFAGDGEAAASAMITQNPNLAGLWAVWDVPAEGALAAARASGRTDLNIVTEDLGTNVAIALAKDEMIVGLGAQLPYDQGVAEANLAALALLGEDTPPYVAVSALPVTHDNVLEAWEQVYHSEPPASVRDSYTD